MTKARILANLISDNAELADGQISVAEVVGAAPLASPTFTGTASGTFSGPLTGNVTGDLTGNVTGDLTGDVNTTLIASPTLNATVNIKTTDANGEGIGLGIDADKKVRFYDDQGSSTKMYWNASTVTQKFEDNSKLAFGSSENLKLYHDGTNKLVGDLTQTGKLTTDATDLSALAATISDTAVDIFVYDTRKDSDGGAWRKRTQGTSWYNETLNTATRGSRKEFPSVAVIVVHQLTSTGKVTIYDGDDPDMPMWMVLNGSSHALDLIPSFSTTSLSCVSALNGIVMVGNGTYDIDSVNFVEDAGYKWSNSSKGKYNGNIEQRADGLAFGGNYGSGIVDRAVNDVAMTVLPNAPIDAATGLPVPTIAVATDGGVSVIKDDGAVVSSSHAFGSSIRISITSDGLLYATHNGPTSGQALEVIDLLSLKRLNNLDGNNAPFHGTNTIGGQHRYYGFGTNLNTTSHNMPFLLPKWGETAAHAVTKDHFALGGDGNNFGISNSGEHKSLIRIAEEPSNPANGMVNLTNTSYNTGWMNGDIKLATLSDTDDTDVTGSDLVGSATLYATARVSGQTYTAGSSTVGIDDDEATPDGYVALALGGLTSGKVYTVTMVADQAYSPSSTAYTNFVDVDNVGKTIDSSLQGTTTTQTVTFTAGTTNRVFFYSNYSGGTLTYTWTLRLAEEDRSVNGNGLQVFGTVTKTPVATGADLVAYSGFGTSAYLQQPYNSDLDFGTGDFCYQFWEKHSQPPSSADWIISWDRDATSAWVLIGTVATGMRFEVAGSSFVDVTPPLGTWNCWHFIRRGGVCYVYLNGKQQASFVSTHNLNASARGAGLRVGKIDYTGSNDYWKGSVALVRISGTAPSPEQIKKIYEDEKVLFQENAQATLYGSSDAVTALAYDDTTELLHVGTSAGRSDFQGLRRVDNTTDAVGAAISASNGLVAED
jgi:hypothetical protein